MRIGHKVNKLFLFLHLIESVLVVECVLLQLLEDSLLFPLEPRLLPNLHILHLPYLLLVGVFYDIQVSIVLLFKWVMRLRDPHRPVLSRVRGVGVDQEVLTAHSCLVLVALFPLS
jgi:hypothetical protein